MRQQLGVAPSRTTDDVTKAYVDTAVAGAGGGTTLKASGLPDLTVAEGLAVGDNFLVRNLSDTSQSATTGSLSEVTPQALYAALRKLFGNQSVASQGPGFATDTYLTGSNIAIPSGFPIVGTSYRLKFYVTKTAAGTATPIIVVRIGTLGTTADAAICTFTFPVGTAAVDEGPFEVLASFRTVGSGTAAVLQGTCTLISNLFTGGISNSGKAKQATSAGFNSTTASLIIGASYNAGASAAHTVSLVRAELLL